MYNRNRLTADKYKFISPPVSYIIGYTGAAVVVGAAGVVFITWYPVIRYKRNDPAIQRRAHIDFAPNIPILTYQYLCFLSPAILLCDFCHQTIKIPLPGLPNDCV